MKNNNESRLLAFVVLLFGLLAMTLRRILYQTAVDEKGLLLSFTFPEVALLVLTSIVLVFLLLMLRGDKITSCYKDLHWSRLPAALGHTAAAGGMVMTLQWGSYAAYGTLTSVWNVLGYASAACLVLAGILRLLGKKPFFLLHVVPCLFFMVHLLIHCRYWSSIPQMQEYLFALLGALALMLFSYYTAAMEADCGNSCMLWGTALAAVYFCLAELAWSAYPELYLGGMFWALTGLCRKMPETGKKD